MDSDLARKVGAQAARRLSAFAEKARRMSPVPVLDVLLFGSRARGDASRDSDWDVAIVVQDTDDVDFRKARRSALNIFADLALADIAAGFHLRPIVIPATDLTSHQGVPGISRSLANNIRADAVRIA